jgi:hypothetical protein
MGCEPCHQHPVIDVMPPRAIGPVAPATPVVPAAPGEFNVPNVPVVGERPVQGETETPGTGSSVVGLSPGVPSSVEPSGIVPLLIDPGVNLAVVDPVIIDVDPSALPNVVELQVVAVALVEPGIVPPPSNVDIDPANPVADVVAPEQGLVLAVGLRPPVFNSVAPRGIPLVCDAVLRSIVPSGEVAPMPGVGAICAKHGPQPIRQAATAMVIMDRIEASTDSAPQLRRINALPPWLFGDRVFERRLKLHHASLVPGRCQPGCPSKRRGERTGLAEPDGQADVGDRDRRLCQQQLGALDTPLRVIAMRRHTEGLLE